MSKRAEGRSQTLPRSTRFSVDVSSLSPCSARDDVSVTGLSPRGENFDSTTEEYTSGSDDETASSVCMDIENLNTDLATASLPPGEDRNVPTTEGDDGESEEETASVVSSEVGDLPLVDTLDLATRTHDHSVYGVSRVMLVAKTVTERYRLPLLAFRTSRRRCGTPMDQQWKRRATRSENTPT